MQVCLTSNIGNGFKVKNYEEHPIKLFHEYNVPFNLCMDNWLLSGDKLNEVEPNNELKIASKLIGWSGVKEALISGAKSAFSPIVDEIWIQNYVKTLDEVFEERLRE